ncbi:hypothetical protein EZV62_010479 [Acer yangbiense]|uniref:Uncharacterized protein n=1 Tax=Acer yangbiense TaxID=1000413 RepID=A0A5C7I2Z8_9ROSI|nr:hypothetical protein EZV62_010479 [Acer yangbiense]
MNPNEISRLCAELSIHGEEEKLWSVQDTITKAAEKKLDLCLVGKILSPKHVNRETFRVVIPRIWQTKVDIELARVGDIERLPFDRVVFWLQIINKPFICMTKEMGEFIGRCLGDLVDIDVGVTSECFGKYMRLRVTIDVSKLLKRFLGLELKQGVESMLLIRYERLLKYCFHYGIIEHSYQLCQSRKENDGFGLRRELDNNGWERNEHHDSGSHVQFAKEAIDQQRPQSVGMEEDLQERAGQQMGESVVMEKRTVVLSRVHVLGNIFLEDSILDDNSTGIRGDKKIFVSCQEETYLHVNPKMGVGICPPLIMSKVMVESDFRFKSVGSVGGNRVCCASSEVDVENKKALQVGVLRKKTELALVYGVGGDGSWNSDVVKQAFVHVDADAILGIPTGRVELDDSCGCRCYFGYSNR